MVTTILPHIYSSIKTREHLEGADLVTSNEGTPEGASAGKSSDMPTNTPEVFGELSRKVSGAQAESASSEVIALNGIISAQTTWTTK